jgi:trimeric autotransporter adhesin
MRRFLTLVFMFCLAIPAGITITGCTRNPAGNYCPGYTYGIKNTEVTSITLQPQTTGISLAYGQTQQTQTPTATTCTGATAEVSSSSYTYGTSNNKLVDISPTGNMCAGTWNRNTGGGISDYTTCSAPDPAPSTCTGTTTQDCLPYGVAYVTASAHSVTSNPVEVFVHAQVSSVSLVGPQKCLSQTQTATLDSQACYSSGGTQYLLCAPASVTSTQTVSPACGLASGQTLSNIPTCASSIGFLSYVVGTSSVGTINADTNQITANLPGTSAITASIAGSGSSAGYFSTCPPQSISLSLADGTTAGTITKGVTQNLTTKVVDTNSVSITGLTLDYQSTNPIDIGVGTTGAITASYPGVASLYAVCQPSSCNPSPINELGLYGTGLSVASNPVTVTTPGTISDYAWFAAPGQSKYFVSANLLAGTVSSTVRMPYVPNSMVMDKNGSTLYFGSSRELMIYNALTSTLTKQDTNVPGVVLAVSPSNALLLVNDQARQLFYLYNVSSASYTSFGGMGNAAVWTPDSKTLYITDNAALNNGTTITGHDDKLYVYNLSTGWSTYSLPPSPLPAGSIPSATLAANVAVSSTQQTPALTIPSVGAYLRGTPTVAHTWCPMGTVTSTGSTITALYPGAYPGDVATSGGDSQAVQSDVLTATTDGAHILGAALLGGGITLSDIAVSVPNSACSITTSGSGSSLVETLNPLTIGHAATPYTQASITANATAINQIVASPVSNLAFITYGGSSTNAQLPFYLPASGGVVGTVGYVALSGAASITAPLTGAFTSDNSTFFVSTQGDNKIHYITIPASPSLANPPTDSEQISPNLPACDTTLDSGCAFSGTDTIVPATAIAVVPRSTT